MVFHQTGLLQGCCKVQPCILHFSQFVWWFEWTGEENVEDTKLGRIAKAKEDRNSIQNNCTEIRQEGGKIPEWNKIEGNRTKVFTWEIEIKFRVHNMSLDDSISEKDLGTIVHSKLENVSEEWYNCQKQQQQNPTKQMQF